MAIYSVHVGWMNFLYLCSLGTGISHLCKYHCKSTYSTCVCVTYMYVQMYICVKLSTWCFNLLSLVLRVWLQCGVGTHHLHYKLKADTHERKTIGVVPVLLRTWDGWKGSESAEKLFYILENFLIDYYIL